METLAVMAVFADRAADSFATEDLRTLDALAQQGTFSTRDPEWRKEAPETRAVNLRTYVDPSTNARPAFADITIFSRSDATRTRSGTTSCFQSSIARTARCASLTRASRNATSDDPRRAGGVSLGGIFDEPAG
jgi:hypothetical protein